MTQVFLPDLFSRLPVDTADLPAVPITSVVADSRQVQAGSLFVACRGDAVDGHRFIPDALRRGAAAVVGEEGAPQAHPTKIPYIWVENSRKALAELSAAFYGYPAHRLTVIGVTGTDGKTTTTSLIYSVLLAAGLRAAGLRAAGLRAAGLRAGMISTVNAVIGDQVLDTGFHVTTPDAPDVQRYLAQMVAAGLTHVVLETTSHGLAQFRVDACEFDVAVVTNITHEHLDYHGSYENYRAAKARLFEMLAETPPKPQGNPRLAVLNRDDRSYAYLAELCSRLPGVRTCAYGLQPGGEVWAEEVLQNGHGLEFTARGPSLRLPLSCVLVGEYNLSNILAAVGAATAGLGIAPEDVQAGIAALRGVPGRMERIDYGQDFLAFVDFAHTPNALKVTLETARQLAPEGKVIAVFGSAGLRDRQKRRLMAETSLQLADLTVLTAEDPRSEPLDGILAEMAAGALAQGGVEGETFWRVPDRGEAIRFALSLARPGDIVLACGKGHEQSMCFGATEYHWDDRTALRAALAEQLGVLGPEMPRLPTSIK